MTQTALISIGNTAGAPVARVAEFPCQVRQWELVDFAGEGSLARVYRARPVRPENAGPAAYAVKMLRPAWQDDSAAIGLLRREALVGSSVSHPHLVPILAAHVIDPPRLLVMPWLEGPTLQARLAAGQMFDVPWALWIARQTAEALDALHAAGWMHGDVTPGNIHVSPAGHVTLLDLSFARRRDETGSAVDRPIVGTCSYIAPECITSALRADIRSDIYSLGAVLFEVVCGRAPYEATGLAHLATQHRQSAPPDPSRLAPHLPRELLQLLRRMLARDPLRRPQSPRELIDRLVALEVATFSQRAYA